jgi:hypothetical protein
MVAVTMGVGVGVGIRVTSTVANGVGVGGVGLHAVKSITANMSIAAAVKMIFLFISKISPPSERIFSLRPPLHDGNLCQASHYTFNFSRTG